MDMWLQAGDLASKLTTRQFNDSAVQLDVICNIAKWIDEPQNWWSTQLVFFVVVSFFFLAGQSRHQRHLSKASDDMSYGDVRSQFGNHPHGNNFISIFKKNMYFEVMKIVLAVYWYDHHLSAGYGPVCSNRCLTPVGSTLPLFKGKNIKLSHFSLLVCSRISMNWTCIVVVRGMLNAVVKFEVGPDAGSHLNNGHYVSTGNVVFFFISFYYPFQVETTLHVR